MADKSVGKELQEFKDKISKKLDSIYGPFGKKTKNQDVKDDAYYDQFRKPTDADAKEHFDFKMVPKVNPKNPNDTQKEYRKPTDADASDYFELKITPKRRNK